MTTKDPVNSVHDEQFDAEDKASEVNGEESVEIAPLEAVAETALAEEQADDEIIAEELPEEEAPLAESPVDKIEESVPGEDVAEAEAHDETTD
jgi:hypothetical protein